LTHSVGGGIKVGQNGGEKGATLTKVFLILFRRGERASRPSLPGRYTSLDSISQAGMGNSSYEVKVVPFSAAILAYFSAATDSTDPRIPLPVVLILSQSPDQDGTSRPGCKVETSRSDYSAGADRDCLAMANDARDLQWFGFAGSDVVSGRRADSGLSHASDQAVGSSL